MIGWSIALTVWALAVVVALLTIPVRMDREKLRREVRRLRRAESFLHEQLGLCLGIATAATGWRLLHPEHAAGQAVTDLRMRLMALEEAVNAAPPSVREQIRTRAITGRARVAI